MLHRLVRTAPADSDESVFAHRQLAELIAPRHPWRAALYARRVVALRPTDDRGWAILAFAQTLLENYRFAASAYARALACSPKNPWYAHNLGHLLDVALDRPNEALPWLAAAFAAARDHVEVATSYAHALARAGELTLAKRILTRAMRSTGTGPTREQAALWRWFERGAPGPAKRDGRDGRDGTSAGQAGHERHERQAGQQGRSPGGFVPSLVSVDVTGDVTGDEVTSSSPSSPSSRGGGQTPRRARARMRARPASTRGSQPPPALSSEQAHGQHSGSTGSEDNEVEQILLRQVAHLPFDAHQRARARAFAREVRGLALLTEAKADAVAAAVAYAIVAHDEVPLTQAEVAATFRVPVSALRARYHQLRSALASPSPVRSMTGLLPEARIPLRASRSSRPPRHGHGKAKK
jgi:hypothetical protein